MARAPIPLRACGLPFLRYAAENVDTCIHLLCRFYLPPIFLNNVVVTFSLICGS